MNYSCGAGWCTSGSTTQVDYGGGSLNAYILLAAACGVNNDGGYHASDYYSTGNQFNTSYVSTIGVNAWGTNPPPGGLDAYVTTYHFDEPTNNPSLWYDAYTSSDGGHSSAGWWNYC